MKILNLLLLFHKVIETAYAVLFCPPTSSIVSVGQRTAPSGSGNLLKDCVPASYGNYSCFDMQINVYDFNSEILPIRRKTLSNQSIEFWIETDFRFNTCMCMDFKLLSILVNFIFSKLLLTKISITLKSERATISVTMFHNNWS